LSGFLHIDVDRDIISVKYYEEVGSLPNGAKSYQQSGSLVIEKKQGTSSSSSEKSILSSGALKIVKWINVLLKFDFEIIAPMSSRPIPSLVKINEDNEKIGLVASDIDVRGVNCSHAMPNHGQFGRKYTK